LYAGIKRIELGWRSRVDLGEEREMAEASGSTLSSCPVQKIRSHAEELPGHDRDPRMTYLPDERA
jgi:hypothetical protein